MIRSSCAMDWSGYFWFLGQSSSCRMARNSLHGAAYTHIYVVCTKQVFRAPVHAGLYIPQVFLTSPYISATQSLQGVHMRSLVRSLYICVGGRGCGCSTVTSLRSALFAWRWGLFLTEGETEVSSCVFSFFDASESVRGCMLDAHAHTHCTWVA